MTLDPADIAREAIERYHREQVVHDNVREVAKELAVEHIRGTYEGAHIVFDADCCGREPVVHERHAADCERRPPGDNCLVCQAMR